MLFVIKVELYSIGSVHRYRYFCVCIYIYVSMVVSDEHLAQVAHGDVYDARQLTY